MAYLGLDIGTSAVKAVVLNDDGILIADASAGLKTDQPKPGWSEQNPEDWLSLKPYTEIESFFRDIFGDTPKKDDLDA